MMLEPRGTAATATGRQLLERAATDLIDAEGRRLAAAVQWWTLPGFSDEGEQWPVAVLGEGPPLLLLHGFDSSLLEFRRLVPLLAPHHHLLIPDLHGFGFCPRPSRGDYSPTGVLRHLEALLEVLLARGDQRPLGLIGASMGAAAAVALARRQPHRIDRLLLLAPAGLTGRAMPLPPLLDGLGVRLLALPAVRRGLCCSAFAAGEAAVGPGELEIASLPLQAPGWSMALARFARSGGFAGSGHPLPPQPLRALWGRNDRILRPAQKRAARQLLGDRVEDLEDCGHLPHLDQPERVLATWRQMA